jgi:hypothetical protein
MAGFGVPHVPVFRGDIEIASDDQGLRGIGRAVEPATEATVPGAASLNNVLWGVQIFLALFFLGAGAPKLLGRGLERWTGFSGLARPLVIFIGWAEVLGAAGLVSRPRVRAVVARLRRISAR